MSLPTQQHVMKAIARTMGELGGLRDGLLRLATDMGSGIDVNRSLGRQRPDGRWEVDRVLPRSSPNVAAATVELSGPLVDGRGGEIAAADADATLSIRGDGVPGEGPASPALPLPPVGTAPGTDEVLVTLRVTLPEPPAGPLWTGFLVRTFVDEDDQNAVVDGTVVAEEYRVEFWVRDLP